MATKKQSPKPTKPAKKNPAQKTAFKRTCITISEVENGFEVAVQWAFNDDTSSANHDDNCRDYVTKTEEEALDLAQKLVPALVEDDEPGEDED